MKYSLSQALVLLILFGCSTDVPAPIPNANFHGTHWTGAIFEGMEASDSISFALLQIDTTLYGSIEKWYYSWNGSWVYHTATASLSGGVKGNHMQVNAAFPSFPDSNRYTFSLDLSGRELKGIWIEKVGTKYFNGSCLLNRD
jgi:hypothetical protein